MSEFGRREIRLNRVNKRKQLIASVERTEDLRGQLEHIFEMQFDPIAVQYDSGIGIKGGSDEENAKYTISIDYIADALKFHEHWTIENMDFALQRARFLEYKLNKHPDLVFTKAQQPDDDLDKGPIHPDAEKPLPEAAGELRKMLPCLIEHLETLKAEKKNVLGKTA